MRPSDIPAEPGVGRKIDQAQPYSYQEKVLQQIARVMGLLDDNPASDTHGCFDRNFWYYRSLVGFPGASWQQAAFGLALIWNADKPDNRFFRKPELLKACVAGIEYWCRIQHRDGSFDEWYRYEQSFCATAVTTFGMSQTVALLANHLDEETRLRAELALARAGRWLAGRYNPDAANQNLAAAAALHTIAASNSTTLKGKPTSESLWAHLASDAMWKRIAAEQSDEGWLPEYGGCDPGYTSLGLDFLAAAEVVKPHPVVRRIALRLVDFLDRIQGLRGPFPGYLGSRGTAHLFPYGAEHFSDISPAAQRVATRWRSSHAMATAPGPAEVDDRYLCYFYLPHFALAYARSQETGKTLPTTRREDTLKTDLQHSGFLILANKGVDLFVSRHLGGALVLQSGGHTLLRNLGYEIQLANGQRHSSVHWSEIDSPSAGGDKFDLPSVPFSRVSAVRPLERWNVLFLLISPWLSSTKIGRSMQAFIRRRLVLPDKQSRFHLQRCIRLEEKRLHVIDVLTAKRTGPDIISVFPAIRAAIYAPSDSKSSPQPTAAAEFDTTTVASELSRTGVARLETVFDLTSGVVTTKVGN